MSAQDSCAEKPKAHLQLWHAVRTIAGSRHLVGFVFGHPRLEDGHRIVTTDIIRVRLVAQQQIQAETLNTIYQLGHVGAQRRWITSSAEVGCR
jgi:hypothetical protein